MTRAFHSLLHFNLSNALWQNILCIPVFCGIFAFIICLLKDIILNENKYIEKLLIFLQKYYLIILFSLFISFIFNNIKKGVI